MSHNDTRAATPATPADYGPLCLACGVHMDALWRCPCCEAEHAIPDAPAAPAEGAPTQGVLLACRHGITGPCGECFSASVKRSQAAAPPPGNDVVCGDHWHGLSGEAVDGSMGCPWCHVADLQRQIATMEDSASAPAADPDPDFARLVDVLMASVELDGFHGEEEDTPAACRSALVSAWEALRAERDEAERWRVAVADGLGYLNRPEGQGGYEVAEPRVIIDAFRCRVAEVAAAEARAEAAEKERDDVLKLLETLRAHFLGRLDAGDTTPILFCGWCGTPVTGPEEFRAHAVTCEKNPPVRRALDAEAALAGLLAVADGDHCACGDPACTATREAWDRARAMAGPGADTAGAHNGSNEEG